MIKRSKDGEKYNNSEINKKADRLIEISRERDRGREGERE